MASVPSTLSQGFNITLAVSLSAGYRDRDSVTPCRYAIIRPHWLKVVFGAGKCISHLQGVELIVVSPQRLQQQCILVRQYTYCVENPGERVGEGR